jgi:hypothetical protein
MSNEENMQFLEYHEPALDAGDYKIQVKQHIPDAKINKTFNSGETFFSVRGERFSMNPSVVHAMFPPPGNLGRHTDVLPHISLTRSTFPWERSAYGNQDYVPWLTLLLFTEEELNSGDVEQKTMSLKELINSNDAKFPAIILEKAQKEDDQVTVIDVKKSLLAKIIPTGEELKKLAHVRRRVNGDKDVPEAELAVIMGNRLPEEGANSTSYLVSVEGRYKKDMAFNFQSAKTNDKIRLVYLKSWGFSCLPEEGKDFEELIEGMSSGVLRMPRVDNKDTEKLLSRGYVPLSHTLRQCDKTYSWYHGPLGTHGIDRKFARDKDLPDFGDALIRYHKDIGMFDTSYAAAFELGRALALEDNLFSPAVFQWKHTHNLEVCKALQAQKSTTQNLLANSADEKNSASAGQDILKKKITGWFEDLALLKGIPFNYLIPDEKMLPQERMAFFKVDNHWLECLLYGAFTIGGRVRKKSDKADDNTRIEAFKTFSDTLTQRNLAGFIIRSELVLDYPDLMVDAYRNKIDHAGPLPKTGVEKFAMIRMERLGPEILLCLYEDKEKNICDIKTAELYLKPEGLHFGLDEESGALKKELRTEYLFKAVNNHLPKGKIAAQSKLTEIQKTIADGSLFPFNENAQAGGAKFEFPVSFRSHEKQLLTEERVLDIAGISNTLDIIFKRIATKMTGTTDSALPLALKSVSSAQMGMHMLEGSNKGRFVII